MAYVAAFDWDVFISYAHVDNAEAWVDKFHKRLEIKLAQLAGRAGDIKIWRDERLDGGQLFNEVIESRLRGSAVFLALFSHGYQGSEYCRQELDFFHSYFGGEQSRVGERPRILNVRLYDIPREKWPAAFGGRTGFEFFTGTGPETSGEPLDPESKEFRSKMTSLCNPVLELLKEMRNPRQEESPRAPDEKFDVYLAHVSDSKRLARSRLKADLEAKSFTVVADPVPPPHPAKGHEDKVLSVLKSCRLSVHLLDEWGDDPIEGDETTTYGRKQVELAQRCGVPQIIWVPKEIPISVGAGESPDVDIEQRSFLHKLEAAERGASAYSFVRSLPSELASEIADRIEQIRKQPAAPEGQRAVLLDTHVKDQLLALDIYRMLLEKHVQPYLNPEEDNPRQQVTEYARRLQQVQALIILFGSASEQWVRARLGEALKISAEVPTHLKACGILMAPPDRGKNQAAFQYPMFRLQVLDNRNGLNPGTLDPFLHGLGLA